MLTATRGHVPLFGTTFMYLPGIQIQSAGTRREKKKTEVEKDLKEWKKSEVNSDKVREMFNRQYLYCMHLI